jgi:hemerythrin superfamily protein
VPREQSNTDWRCAVAHDVVDLIMQDHREVERLFEELRTPEKRAGLVPLLTTLLTAHSRAEEAEVYPVARDEAGIAGDVAHSQEEHVQAEEVLARLSEVDPNTPQFERLLQEAIDSVGHHVQEEEAGVLPALRSNLSAERLAELADAFLAARSAHLGEQPGDLRKTDLEQQAANIGISGASQMSKAELSEELSRRAADSEE